MEMQEKQNGLKLCITTQFLAYVDGVNFLGKNKHIILSIRDARLAVRREGVRLVSK
jgi:hypothetical protein